MIASEHARYAAGPVAGATFVVDRWDDWTAAITRHLEVSSSPVPLDADTPDEAVAPSVLQEVVRNLLA
jgi:hypothetical protein